MSDVLARCKANRYYRGAVESPEFLDVVALQDKARAALLALRPSAPPVTTPDHAGADLGVWLAGVAEADAAQRVFEVQRQALQGLLNSCASRIESAGVVPDPILASLNADLEALWERVGDAVDQLKGARTVREVLAADVTGPWKALSALRDEYDQIRTAQTWTLLGRTTLRDAASHYVSDDHASDAYIANLDEVWPEWDEPDRTQVLRGDHSPRRQPWPADPVEELVWLYDHAEVWIPTMQQLEEHRQERYARLNPAGERRVHRVDAIPSTTSSVYEGKGWGELLGGQAVDEETGDEAEALDELAAVDID